MRGRDFLLPHILESQNFQKKICLRIQIEKYICSVQIEQHRSISYLIILAVPHSHDGSIDHFTAL